MKRCLLLMLTVLSATYLYGQYYSGPNADPEPDTTEEDVSDQPQEEYVPAQPNPENEPSVYQDDVMPISEVINYEVIDYEVLTEEYPYEDESTEEEEDDDDSYDYDSSYGDSGYTDVDSEEDLASRPPLVDPYPVPDPNNVKSIIIQLPFTNITLIPPYAPYQTYDTSKLKSGRIPQIASSKSLLQNLDKTIWRLKFYNHPDNQSMESVLLKINEPELTLTTTMAPADTNSDPKYQIPASRSIDAKYRLTLVKSLRPGEAIYAYDAGGGIISFMYIRLIMPHLLAFDMARDFDTIAKAPEKSINDLGVFTLE
ncbi:MAG: hypothetical protein ACRC9L_07050 [Brevinema sp.]